MKIVPTYPTVQMVTILSGEFEGSYLSVSDLREYLDWLAEKFPDDAKTIKKLDEAILSGIVKRASIPNL